MSDTIIDAELAVRIQKHKTSKLQHIPISHCIFVKTLDNKIVQVLTGAVVKESGKNYFFLMENKGSWFYNTLGGKYTCFCDYLGQYETTDIYEFRQYVPKYTNNEYIK